MATDEIALALAIGRQTVRDEHEFFATEGTDNSEHIPRIARIAESVRKSLLQSGAAQPDADRVKRAIVEYGRQLFVEEWMKITDSDGEPPSENEALAEFKRLLRGELGQWGC